MTSTANAVFALLLLTSGYFFLRRWGLSRAHLFRSDGHALYFLVVGAAFILALITTLAWHDVLRVPLLGQWLATYVDRLLSVFTTDTQALKFGTTAVLSLPFAFALAENLNIPLRRCISLRGRLLLRLSCLSELEEFLWMTSLRRLPVMVTLSSAKVYIGYTMDEPPTSRGESKWVQLEPLLSGYRDEHHEFKPTTSYAWMHSPSPVGVDSNMQISDFDVLLPTEEIKSVHAFDLPTYASKFQEPTTVDSAISPRAARQQSSNPPRSKAENAYWAFVIAVLIFPLVELAAGWISALTILFLIVFFAIIATLPEEE
jgi:prepilin signal peptidase PulO-like enzyme (type II secretory pathway)